MVISGRLPPISVQLQPNIEVNDTPKAAIKHCPSKQLNMKNEDTDQLCIQSCLCMDGQTYDFSWAGSGLLTGTEVLSEFAGLHRDTMQLVSLGC